MLMIGKAFVLLIFELIIEYLFGTLITKIILKKAGSPIFNLLIGFFAYQALFQPIALFIVFTTGILHHLTITWSIVLLFTMILSIVQCKGIIKEQIVNCVQLIKEYKIIILVVGLVVIAFCYYVSINGEQNDDARYYIALMTTTVDTDTMFQYNVYNGYHVDSLYLRRVLATFEMHSAVLSQISGIHPLIIARIFRACQNVILTSGAVYLCGYSLFWNKEEDIIKKSLLTVIGFWFVQLFFSNTIYTSATFLLYRAYEAKAFAANVVVLTGLYLCASILRQRNYRILILLIIFGWGSMALSVSAMMVAGLECAILLLPNWLMRWFIKKKQERHYAG